MRLLRWIPVLLVLGGVSGCATLGAPRARDAQAEEAIHGPMRALPSTPEEFLKRARGVYVVVDLDVNRLRLMDGGTQLWDAPVGTGTGLRLEGKTGEWDFSTPRGVFQIQFKEELPVWVRPDWYYVEKKLPIPPPEAPEREVEGQLGIAAVYLGADIAIHGTDKPELLGQRVSHGCIRLANDNVLRLFHNVQVGTPVVIVGGEHLDKLPPPPSTDPGRPGKKKERDPFAGVSTRSLLTRLDGALVAPDSAAGWVRIASRLITRGLKDDAVALRGLLERAGKAGSAQRNREYATFLADAFARGSLRTVVSLARIDEESRTRAARDIVEATMALYPLASDLPSAPWPTRRVPPAGLGPAGREGWEALASAEAAYRSGEQTAARAEAR